MGPAEVCRLWGKYGGRETQHRRCTDAGLAGNQLSTSRSRPAICANLLSGPYDNEGPFLTGGGVGRDDWVDRRENDDDC